MNYKLHDTHGHLDLLFEKQELIVSREGAEMELDSKKIGELSEIATKMLEHHSLFIQPTVSTMNFELNYKLWHQLDTLKILIGSHPEIVNYGFDVNEYCQYQRKVITKIREDSHSTGQKWQTKIIGIGEVGLDYYYTDDKSIQSKQQELFVSQIELALELDVPIVIHCRDAFDDVLAILREYPAIYGKFDIHCFTGDRDTAKKILDFGGFLGIGGILTFKNADFLRESVSYAPIDSLLIETDLPFLAPHPHRGKPCLPIFVDEIAKTIGQIKSIDHYDVWQELTDNVSRLYTL